MAMDILRAVIRQMISTTEEELAGFLGPCRLQSFKKKDLLSQPGRIANEVFFIKKGMIRVMITDLAGTEHTTHFALENQFIADYSSFLQNTPANYQLQALEDTDTVVLTREAIEWGYKHMKEGEKIGRLIAEFYFTYLDNRIYSMYAKSPKERYDHITQVFPNIHNRAPQHMIASYIGITAVHLSRLKKMDRAKL
ncbi:MAG: Crp/Fnr family transcriptional regulator [Bacteroidota bacterium]